MAWGITNDGSLRGSSAGARGGERCAVSECGYASPFTQLDTSPPAAPIALAQFEMIKAYLHYITRNQGAHEEEGERKEAVRRFRRLEEEVMAVDNDEWMQGRTMYLACALQLQASFSGDGVLQGTIERFANAIYERSEEHARQLYESAVDSFRREPPRLADPEHTRVPPLFCYTKDRWPWLGARHGLVGVLHTLLCVPSVLKDGVKRQKIRDTVEWILRQEKDSGEFCAVAFTEPGEKPNWGDGGGGAVMLFAKAFEVFEDPKFCYAANRAAERLWTYALARGSDGLLEGTTGNGYAFLRMHNCARLAVERCVFNNMCAPEQWVHRAHMCARFILESENTRPAEFDLSLADGKAGIICFLVDMLDPGHACFPLFEIEPGF
jgi:hypothetical protein